MDALPLTGERTAPGIWHETYWFARHLVAYRRARERVRALALALARPPAVVDLGCGEGYGVRLLSDAGARAVGVELVHDVVDHARRTYPQATFLQAELGELPLRDRSLDLAVSFQVIEHLWDVPAHLAETARVLRPGARFLCATPNRLTFTPGSDTPVNPFHVREFTAAELVEALSGHFVVERVLGVRHGARLRRLEDELATTLPELVLSSPPERWPAWQRELVSGVRAHDFDVTPDDVDTSLDLLAIARTR